MIRRPPGSTHTDTPFPNPTLCRSATPATEQEDNSGITITGSAAVVSDYRFRGVSQTGEEADIQGSIGISHESGLYAGVWGSSVDLGENDGVVFEDLNTELDAYVGYKREVEPGLTTDGGLLYYYYPHDSKIPTEDR